MKKMATILTMSLFLSAAAFAGENENAAFGGFSQQYQNLFHQAAERKDAALYDKLLQNYEAQYKSLDQEGQKKFQSNLSDAYSQLSNLYLELGDKQKALGYLQKSVAFAAN